MLKVVFESGEVMVLNYFECSLFFFCFGINYDGIIYEIEEFLLYLVLLFSYIV